MANKAKVTLTATDKTRAAFASAQRNVSGLSSSIGGLKAGLASLIGAAGFGALIKSTVDTADKIQKLSISLGASTEALSEYQLVASRSGTTLESLSLIWQRMTRRTAEAAVGTGEARDALRELGISATELAKLSPDRQFEVIADAMANVTSQSDKLRLAFKLFDSEGARPALQAMEGGSAALREMRREARDMGITLTQVEADALAGFNDELKDAQLRLKGAAQQITIGMIPALTGLINKLTLATQAAADFFALFDRPVDGSGPAEALSNKLARLVDEQEKFIALSKEADNPALLAGYQRRLEEIRVQITGVRGELDALFRSTPAAVDTGGGGFGPPQGTIADEKAAAKAAERAAAEEARLIEQQNRRITAILESVRTEQEVLQEAHEEKILFLEEAYQSELIGFEEKEQAKLELERQYAEERARQEKKISATQVKLRADVVSKSIGLLQQLGTKSKAFAVAAILLESIIAAKRVYIQSQVAAMAALTPPPIGLGPVAGQPLAASIRAMGIASAGLTLASGALQLGSLSGGSSSGGVSGTFDADPLTGLPTTATSAVLPLRTDITINIGDAQFLSAEGVRLLIEQINEQIDDGVNIGSIAVS